MSVFEFFSRGTRSSGSQQFRCFPRRKQPRIECLEDRRLLAVSQLVADLTDTGIAWIDDDQRAVAVGDEFYFFNDREKDRSPLSVIPAGSTISEPLDGSIIGPYHPEPLDLTVVGTKILFATEGNGLLGVIDTLDRSIRYQTDGVRVHLSYDVESTIVEMNGRGYYFKELAAGSLELWSSDGTDEGTELIKKIDAGTDADIHLRASDNQLFFFIYSTGQRFLWTSDGSTDGTKMVKEFGVNGVIGSKPENIVTHRDRLFFRSNDAMLWTSDGTEQGTQVVTDRILGSARIGIEFARPFGNNLLFVRDETEGKQWWISDGTIEGTTGLPIPPPNSLVAWDVTDDGVLFYSTLRTGSTASDLLRSDGTIAGTSVVTIPLLASVGILSVKAAGNRVLVNSFSAIDQWLFLTDGSDAGTSILNHSGTGAFVRDRPINGVDRLLIQTNVQGLSVDELVIATDDELQIVRATPAGSRPRNLQVIGDKMVFIADDNFNRAQLWAISAAGETPIKLSDFLGRIVRVDPLDEKPVGDHWTAYYRVFDGEGLYQLWITDGTVAGTHVVANPDGSLVQTSSTAQPVQIRDQLLFHVGQVTWITDGTSSGTRPLAELPGVLFRNPSDFVVAGSRTYFVADTNDDGRKWHVTESDFSEAISFGSIVSEIGQSIAWGNRLVYILTRGGNRGDIGRVWITDGSDEGTHALTGPNSRERILYPNLTIAADRLFFTELVRDVGNVFHLRVSDGVSPTPQTVFSSSPDLELYDDLLATDELKFFSVRRNLVDGTHQRELWKSDGTVEGTRQVDLGPDITIPNRRHFAEYDGRLYFAGSTAETGVELFVTDGTAGGTQLVANHVLGSDNIYPWSGAAYSASSTPQSLVVFQDRLYYTAESTSIGRELYSIQAIAPSITSIIINDGERQRSQLRSVEIRFDSIVQVDSLAIAIRNLGGNSDIEFQWEVSSDSTGTRMTGRPAEGEILPDGFYEVIVDGSLIQSTGRMLSQNVLTFDSSNVDRLFQHYGDIDGDGLVGLRDFFVFRSSYGTDKGVEHGLDYDKDGIIGLIDFVKFRRNYGKSLEARAK